MKPFKFSPSAAERWMTCPGSVSLIASLFGEEERSAVADEGVQAHIVADALLTGKPIDYGATSASMIQDAAMYAHFVKSAAGNARIESEYRLPLSSVCEGLTSTGVVDSFFFLPQEKCLPIIDFKYGQGVKIEASTNKAMRFYAIALLHELAYLGPVEKVRLVIFQPRIKDKSGNPHISILELTVEELMTFKSEVQAAVTAAKAESPEFVTSEEGCRFCPAFSVCPKQHEGLTAVMDELVASEARPLGADLTPEALSRLALRFSDARKLMAKLEEELESHLKQGTKLPHHKLVESQPKRSWEKDAALRMALELPKELSGELIKLEPKLVGITEAEKFLKKEKGLLEPYFCKKEAVPVVALIGDMRPEWGYNIASKFGEFEKKEEGV